MPAAVSSTGLGPNEKPVRVVSGEASAYYVLGFIGPLGDDSLQAAVEDARSQAKSDTMVNVFVDRQIMNFPFDYFALVSRIQTRVYGTLIQYTDKAEVLPRLTKADVDQQTSSTVNGAAMPRKDLIQFLDGLRKGTLVTFKYRSGDSATLQFITYDDRKEEIWVRQPGTNFLHDNIVLLRNVLDAHKAEIKE
jgi:hypothetical protein